MISADVNVDVKQQETKMYLVFFNEKYLQNFKYSEPLSMYFSLNIAWDFTLLGLVC